MFSPKPKKLNHALTGLTDRNKSASSEKGFTLVELLIVILILGILIAIALPTFLNQSDSAKDAKAKDQLAITYHVWAANSGSISDRGEAVNHLSQSEPELHAAQINAPADATENVVGIFDANHSDLSASVQSASGCTITLIVTGHSKPAFSACDSLPGDDGGSGGSGDPPAANVDLAWFGFNPSNEWEKRLWSGNVNGSSISASTISWDPGGWGPAIEFSQGGVLYGVNSSGDLISFDLASGAESLVTPAADICDGQGIGMMETGDTAASAGSGRMVVDCRFDQSVRIMNLDGSNATTLVTLPPDAGNGGVAYSSYNGGTVVYRCVECGDGSHTSIHSVSSGGGAQQKVLGDDGSNNLWGTQITPSGQLVYITDNTVFKKPISGGAPVALSAPEVTGQYLSLSPDGSQVVYKGFDPDTNLFAVPVAGGSTTRVTNSAADGISPSYAIWLR